MLRLDSSAWRSGPFACWVSSSRGRGACAGCIASAGWLVGCGAQVLAGRRLLFPRAVLRIIELIRFSMAGTETSSSWAAHALVSRRAMLARVWYSARSGRTGPQIGGVAQLEEQRPAAVGAARGPETSPGDAVASR